MLDRLYGARSRLKRLLRGRSSQAVNRPTRLWDLFATGYPRRAMLSYITTPFGMSSENVVPTHTNFFEARSWAAALNQFGYSVDVYDYTDSASVPLLREYEIVCGFGEPFEKALNMRGSRQCHFVFYGTGCHPYFSNRATVARKIEYYQKHHSWPATGGRELNTAWPLQLQAADHYVVLGNRFVADTYETRILRGRIHSLDCFYLGDPDTVDSRPAPDPSRRGRPLWFGSDGCLHKGLDNVLQAVEGLPELILNIAGLNPTEDHMLRLIERYRGMHERVINHGFLRVGSPEFNEVMRLCGVCIFPSASEGGAPAVLTAIMHSRGLPIVTRAVGLDLGESALVLEHGSPSEIEGALKVVLAMSNDEFIARCASVHERVAKYTRARYDTSLRKIFTGICDDGTGRNSGRP